VHQERTGWNPTANQSIKWAHKNVKIYWLIPSSHHVVYPRSFINYNIPLHLLFTFPSPSSFHIFLVNFISHLPLIYSLLCLVLYLFASLCSFLFSVTETTASPSCNFMFKNLQRFHLLLSARVHQMTPILTTPTYIAQIFTLNMANNYAAYYTVEFL
jgi:hypothetical protein